MMSDEKKRKPGPKLDDGEELRGWMVALEPTQEQSEQLRATQRELMRAWNILVISRATHMDHCVRHAEDGGLVDPRPVIPYGPRRPKGDRDSVFRAYAKALGTWKLSAIKAAMKNAPERLGWEAWHIDYKRLREVTAPEHGSVAHSQCYLSLSTTFKRTRCAVIKNEPLRMPLLNGTGGVPVEWSHGEPDPDWGGNGPSKRCTIRFGMGPMRLVARYWRNPPGTLIQGVSISLVGNRWVAAAKTRQQPRVLPRPTRELIAINLGLEVLVATSEGHLFQNPRGNEYTLEMARLQKRIESATEYERDQLERQRRGMAARFARKTKHLILQEILPLLGQYQNIIMHESSQGAAQGAQCRLSVNQNGGYVSAMSMTADAILLRYGDRVREVQSFDISRECSQCGTVHKTRYQRGYRHTGDQLCDCANAGCRGKMHVDENAARNVLGKYLDLQVAAE